MIKIPRDHHKGQRCFIVASGPSIKDMDLGWLKDEVTICVNQSHQALDFDPTYICIGDRVLWPLVRDAYAKMSSKIFCTTGTDGSVGRKYPGENLIGVVPMNMKEHVPGHGFVWDLSTHVHKSWNVISEVVLPFVCWAGFGKCYLIGCDCTGAGYFYENPARGPGHQNFDSRAMQSYETIAATPDLPTRIYNATVGGELECFPRASFVSLKRSLLVCGFYTPNQDYPLLAEKMRESVEAQGVECAIHKRKSLGQKGMPKPMPWVLNCGQCPAAIRTARKRYPNRDLLYMDVDAMMVRRPSFFLDRPRDFDFAAPFITTKYIINQLASNTLYFAATDKANELLEVWWEEQEARNEAMIDGDFRPSYKEVWDQKVLQDVLYRIPGLQWVELPWEYSKMTPTPKGEELQPTVDLEKAVIMQYQCSRWNKPKV